MSLNHHWRLTFLAGNGGKVANGLDINLIVKQWTKYMSDYYDDEPKGLGGWLILVGLNLIRMPIGLVLKTKGGLLFIAAYFNLNDAINAGVVTPHPLLGPIFIGQALFSFTLILAYIFLIYLFLSKHYLFPKTYITVVVAYIIISLILIWLISYMKGEPMFSHDEAGSFLGGTIINFILVFYMLFSRRVKATFVEKRPDKLDHKSMIKE